MSTAVLEIEGTGMDSAKRFVDLEAKCGRLEEQKSKLIGEVSELKARNESLKEKHEKSKDTFVKMEDKLHSEQRKWREERGKIGEECRQLDLEKKILNIDLKAAEAEVKRLTSLLEQRDGPVTNLLGKIEALERQNSMLESDLKAAKMRSQELEKALLDLKSLCEEEDGSIAMLGRDKRKIREEMVVESDDCGMKYTGTTSVSHKNKHKKAMGNGNSECSGKNSEAERIDINNALEAEKREMEKARMEINELSELVAVLEAAKEAEESDKRAMEDEHKKKVLELTRSIEVLEGEKREVGARLIQATKDYRDEIKKISYEKIAAEAEKRALKDKSEREVSEQACRIEVLEWENRDMEVEVSEAKREKNEEIKRILNEMAVLKEKHEKENLELVSRVKILEREKKEVEDKACQEKTASLKENREKIEEIKRILNENAALKEQHDKKILEYVSRVNALESDMEAEKAALKEKNLDLVTRVDVLKKEKRELETKTRKDGVIKVLVQQNECVVTETKRTKMVKNKCIVANLEEDVQLPHQVHPVSNAGILGCKSVDLSSQVGIKRSKSGSVWTTPQQMLNAFTTNDELCMRSICTLYRKHKSLGRWKNCLTSSIFNNGFMPPYEERGVNLGELLTRGDLEGRLKMSLAEFKQADPRVLQDCRLIACDHYKLLFEIYSHNLDPLFQSGVMAVEGSAVNFAKRIVILEGTMRPVEEGENQFTPARDGGEDEGSDSEGQVCESDEGGIRFRKEVWKDEKEKIREERRHAAGGRQEEARD